jgi:hypothetical protein
MKRRLFIAGCALERHRLAGGTLPENLDKLPRSLLPSVPMDLDGKPLRYKVVNGRPVLWSVGANLKDDWQGNPPVDTTFKEDIEYADWQWSLP